ncbi:MAG: hypothetical protein U5K56_16095 [Halioglobus sp.]|nr:hypothetical protein [Halioglobus sp.]
MALSFGEEQDLMVASVIAPRATIEEEDEAAAEEAEEGAEEEAEPGAEESEPSGDEDESGDKD